MKLHPSPNFNDRAAACGLRYVVLHYTGMVDAASALARMCDPASEVSAHYMIDEDGTAFKLVEEDKRAWHAGQSFWKGERDLNSASIGIELVNPGHAFGYRPFPQPQIATLKALLGDLYARYRFSPASLLAHSDIAPSRREDPGERFPWPELAREGFGLWPAPAPPVAPDFTAEDIAQGLRHIGYDCMATDSTASLAAAQQAFLRHYHPEGLETGFGHESYARLKQLERLVDPSPDERSWL